MLKLWFDLSMLGIEAQQVIWLRMMKIAGGGPASERETLRMIEEKFVAAGEAGVQLAVGGDMDALVSGYRRKVRANRRRLSR